jgi:hypothetical protein
VKLGFLQRLPRWLRVSLLLFPVLAFLGLAFGLRFGLRDAKALVRSFRNRQTPVQCIWQGPETDSDISDFAMDSSGNAMVLSRGRLWELRQQTLKSMDASQGVLRLFPDAEPGQIWMAGSNHRVMVWNTLDGLRSAWFVQGTVREIKVSGDWVVVGFEDDQAGKGWVQRFHRLDSYRYESVGQSLVVGMDRYCGFDLSPDGQRILANQPDGRGVAIWSVEDGRKLVAWPVERLARVLRFTDDAHVVFDRGPLEHGVELAQANPRNQLVYASSTASDGPIVVAENFATVLASALWPDRSRLVFSDMEGLLRVVDLNPQPRPVRMIAPRKGGIPWRLRVSLEGIWVLLKGEETRIEAYR